MFFYGINSTSWRKPVFRCHVINLYLKSLFSNKTTIFTKIKLSIDVKFESRRWTVLRKKNPTECPSCPCSKYLKLCGALCHTRIFVQASPFSKKKKKKLPKQIEILRTPEVADKSVRNTFWRQLTWMGFWTGSFFLPAAILISLYSLLSTSALWMNCYSCLVTI